MEKVGGQQLVLCVGHKVNGNLMFNGTILATKGSRKGCGGVVKVEREDMF